MPGQRLAVIRRVALSLVLLALAVIGVLAGGQTTAPEPLATCTDAEQAAALAALSAYAPTADSGFVMLEAGRFSVDGQLYTVRGFNYYPSRYPWRRFLTEMDADSVRAELDLLRSTGANTLRIFLWYGALFQCPG
ncbi:MAG: hypothetical protein KC547_11825, partial [Anaerolineae bacterium]|nr:hypothetical protein [Anaerolineae bacterium]